MTAPITPVTIVAILGTSPRQVRYHLDGRETVATVSAAALAHLLPGPVGRIIAACTPDAEATADVLEAERPPTVPVERLRVDATLGKPEATRFVETLVGVMAGDGSVIVDITNGPRHLAVLTFAAAALAASLGKGTVQGVYYAWVEPPASATRPLAPATDRSSEFASGAYVDLADLVTVFDLVHAARSFAETGSARALIELLSTRGRPSRSDKRIQALRAFSESTQAGLPLEQGRAAAEVLDLKLVRLLRSRNLPVADAVADMVANAVRNVALDSEIARGKAEGWKRRVPLDVQELERQRRAIDEWIQRGAWSTALLAMEEWVISWVVNGSGRGARWLEKPDRYAAKSQLDALRAIHKETEPGVRRRLTPDQARLARFWNALTEARNAFAHAGMRWDMVEPGSKSLRPRLAKIRDDWRWIGEVGTFPLEVDATLAEPLLVSPFGRQPGALYTALLKHPDVRRCLVVCSDETRPRLAEVARAVGRRLEWEPLVLTDPLAGAAEIDPLLERAREHLLDAPEILVHVTGGSSLMYHVCGRIGEQARRYGRPVRYFLTLDRRTRERQDLDPYQEGEIVYLDDHTDGAP